MNLLEYVHKTRHGSMPLWKFCDFISKDLKITRVSVYRFYRQNNLPPARQIQLVKDFNLDPKILIK